MPGDKLVARFEVRVGGRVYRNGDSAEAPGQPISLEITHRDQEASRLRLTVFDAVTDQPFPEYNSVPNPRCNPNIPVEAWGGWEDEQMVKIFEGILARKEMSYQLSQTTFVGLHEAFKLRRRAKTFAFKNLTVAALLRKLAAEEGLVLQIHSSVAGDAALNTPVEVIFQISEPNWKLMLRYIRELGYITNTVKKNVIVLRRSKSDGQAVSLQRGDEWITNVRTGQEHRKDDRSPRRKGHAHEPKPGKFSHHRDGEDCGVSRSVRSVPPAIAKRSTQHKVPFSKFSVRGKARRYKEEGDELTIDLRFRPEMRNEEVINLSGFGGQIDGAWQTSMVVHRLGGQASTTTAECWKP